MMPKRANPSRTSEKRRRPWYVGAFDSSYPLRYQHRSDESAQREAQFALRSLNLPRGATVLDLGCGTGRHSRAMTRAGFDVVGLDLSRDLLRIAATTDSAADRTPSYVRADMRALPLATESMDGVVSMFTSFGYFNSRDNMRVQREVARVLKRGAPFLLDYFNLEWTLRTLVPESEREVNGMHLRERRRFDARTRRLIKTVTVRKTPGAENGGETIRESVRAYAADELAALCAGCGLHVVERFGDLDGARFDPRQSPRCVLLLRNAFRSGDGRA